jgi:murein DD-endopeptidase MepM/ murein hydrolase activator NlpD
VLAATREPAASPVSRRRLLVVALLLTVGALLPSAAPATPVARSFPPPTTGPDPPRVPALWMPVHGAVVRGFDARDGPYGPGHRGIDIAAPKGRPPGRRRRGRSRSPARSPGPPGSASWSLPGFG